MGDFPPETRHRVAFRDEVKIATVGEWIKAAREISQANQATFNCYAASHRLIVGQILALKKSKKRFGPGNGGAKQYREGIDSVSLDIFSPCFSCHLRAGEISPRIAFNQYFDQQ